MIYVSLILILILFNSGCTYQKIIEVINEETGLHFFDLNNDSDTTDKLVYIRTVPCTLKYKNTTNLKMILLYLDEVIQINCDTPEIYNKYNPGDTIVVNIYKNNMSEVVYKIKE